MNINEATKRAAETGGKITRADELWRRTQIEPTDSPECCIVYCNGQALTTRWNPCASDLTAEDWIVLEPTTMCKKEINIEVPTEKIDVAIEKATQLKALLEEVHQLIESLKNNKKAEELTDGSSNENQYIEGTKTKEAVDEDDLPKGVNSAIAALLNT